MARGSALTWGVLAGLAIMAATSMHVLFALSADTPAFPFDEITLLQYSAYLSGAGTPPPVTGAGYFPAWAFVLAPLWWITSDPQTFYHLAIWLGVAVALVTIWPLALLMRRFELTAAQSITVASLVLCMPSRAVQAAYTLSEKLLFLMLVCLALAAFRLGERLTYPRAAVFSLLASLTVFTHVRAVVVLPVSLLWLMFLARRRWRVAFVAFLTTGALSAAAYRYALWLNEHLLAQSFSQGDTLMDNLMSGPAVIARTFLGQAWYQVVSSAGIVLIGIVVLIELAVGRRRGHKVSGVCLWMLGIIAAAMLLSVLGWSSEENLFMAGRGRLDAAIYGRYNDPFTALAVAVGLAALVKGLSRRVLLWSAGIGLPIIIATVYWVAPNAYTWGIVTPAHIPGVLPWGSTLPFSQSTLPAWVPSTMQTYGTWEWLVPTFTNQSRFWLISSVTAVVFWMLLMLLRRAPVPAVSLLLVVCCVAGSLSYPMVELFQRKDGGKPSIVTAVEQVDAEFGSSTVYFDQSCTPDTGDQAWAQNSFAFWLRPYDFRLTDTPNPHGAGLIISCGTSTAVERFGARRLGYDSAIGYGLWVLPGSLQDQLERAGASIHESTR